MRMVLRGDMPVRHAFDGDSGVCVVPLRLSLRNCLPQTASLSIEAGLTVEASQRDGAHAVLRKRLECLVLLPQMGSCFDMPTMPHCASVVSVSATAADPSTGRTATSLQNPKIA